MKEILDQVSKLEITEKSVIVIKQGMSPSQKLALQDHIDGETGIRPPIIAMYDLDVNVLNIEERSVLILKTEWPWDNRHKYYMEFLEQIKKHIGIRPLMINLRSDEELSQFDQEELRQLRDKINEILDEVSA